MLNLLPFNACDHGLIHIHTQTHIFHRSSQVLATEFMFRTADGLRSRIPFKLNLWDDDVDNVGFDFSLEKLCALYLC